METDVNLIKPQNDEVKVSMGATRGAGLARWGSKRKIIILVIIAICFIILLALSIWAIVLKVRLDHFNKFCYSEDCIITSGEILEKSNMKVDPCEDFYDYACGSFLSNALVEPGYKSPSASSDTQKQNNLKLHKLLTDESITLGGKNSSAVAKSKEYFAACMDTQDIDKRNGQPLLEIIGKMGGWPLLGDSVPSKWVESTWSLENALSHAHKYRVFPLIWYDLYPDSLNSSLQEIKFLDATLSHWNIVLYQEKGEQTLKNALIAFISSVAKLLGATNILNTDIDKIWELEAALAQNMKSSEDVQNSVLNDNKVNLLEVNNWVGNWINLPSLLSDVFEKNLLPSDEVAIADEKFLKGLKDIMQRTEKRTQANYIVWITVKKFVSLLSTPFQLAEKAFNKAVESQRKASPRWMKCLDDTISAFGFALGGLFIENYFQITAKKEVEQMINQIMKTFRENMLSMTWLDEKTRKEAFKKLDKMKVKLGYPEFVTSADQLDQYYEKLTVGKHNFENYANFQLFETFLRNSMFGKPVNVDEWIMPPTVYNAYYSWPSNEFVLLAGILQKPLFSDVYPRSSNYGGIGFVIAHEIIHGFDNKGRYYDSDGNIIENWWSPNAEKEFKERASCFNKQYSSYTFYGRNANANLTISEDIADNGGLSLSYSSYKNWLKSNGNADPLLPFLDLTHDQLFFLAFAQSFCTHYEKDRLLSLIESDNHSNNKLRVLATISNSFEFADAFKCPKKSKMNPEKKCSLW